MAGAQGTETMAQSIIISRQDMHDFLTERGFTLIPNLPRTKELVYGLIVRPGVCLRVYTSVEGERTRDNGEDAIRVCLVTKVGDNIVGIGSDRRVHRVVGWRKNLADRLENWTDQLGPDCPKCGKPTVRRRSRRGPFWGCSNYPQCRSVQPIALPTRRPVQAVVVPDHEEFDEARAELEANGIIDSD